MSNEKTKQQAAETGTESHPALGMFGYGIGGFLGLLILVGLAAVLEGENGNSGKAVEELPHAVILLELEDLRDYNTRTSLVEMQQELAATGLAVIGPLNFPILVPGDHFGDAPKAFQLNHISEQDYDNALPYFEAGKWLIPRIFSPDLREAVIRLAPPGRGAFPSGSALKIQAIIEKYLAHFPSIMVYSRALGLEDEAARNRINLHFGVQSANILIKAQEEGYLFQDAIVAQIEAAADGLTDQAVRSATTTGSYVTYAWCVQNHSMTAGINNQTPVQAILEQGRKWNIPLLVDKTGKEGWVEVYTEAEGAANAELCYFLAANYPMIEGVGWKVPRKRPITLE